MFHDTYVIAVSLDRTLSLAETMLYYCHGRDMFYPEFVAVKSLSMATSAISTIWNLKCNREEKVLCCLKFLFSETLKCLFNFKHMNNINSLLIADLLTSVDLLNWRLKEMESPHRMLSNEYDLQ